MTAIGSKEFPEDFLSILSEVFGFEGGIANVAQDHGGFTNMGITKPFLSDYLGRPATDSDIAHLTKEQAVDAYYKNLWQRNGIARFPAFLRREAFNSFTGSLWLGAEFIRACQRAFGLVPDGIVGPMTSAKFREAEAWPEIQQRKLNNRVVADLIRALIGICQREPSQLIFMQGWWNRYSAFFDFGY